MAAVHWLVLGSHAFADGASGVADLPKSAQFELSAGAQAFDRVWSLYSGATVAPFAGIQHEGLRVRATGGYGGYSYSSRGEAYQGRVSFADLLLGYQWQLGPLTLKAFGGIAAEDRTLEPDDVQTAIRGRGAGAKFALESWWNITDQAWSSLDLSWTSLHEAYDARARLGWRLLRALSIGLESGAIGNVECDIGRAGGFLRYEWATGEVSVSGGMSNDRLLQARQSSTLAASVPYATFGWLTRF